jgi:hypothetical protein
VDRTSHDFGRCRLCGAPTRPEDRRCYCCAVLVRQLRAPLVPTVAIAPFRLGDRLHRLLRGYKDAPLAEVRSARQLRLAGLVGGWLDHHGDHLRRHLGPWEVVASVPPSRRPGPAPVDGLVGSVPGLAPDLRRGMLTRGEVPLDHLVADRRGFRVDRGVAGPVRRRRVLVVDDSVTTGARSQSAVAALRAADLEPVGILVVGRAIAPDASPWHAAYWAAHGHQTPDSGGWE